MRIVALRTLREFWEIPDYSDSEQPLKSWFQIAKKAEWSTPQHVKDQFANCSVMGDNRVVFNIAGNKYRLVVKFNYPYSMGYVRFIGTHAEYDEIDVESI